MVGSGPPTTLTSVDIVDYLPPIEADWESWYKQHDRVTVHAPDDPRTLWANKVSGLPRWTVWSWCGYSGGVSAWCDSEGAATLIAATLAGLLGVEVTHEYGRPEGEPD